MSQPGHPPRSAPRPVVVVLGSGRSGTSLLMQGLAALGLRVSEEMIEARRDNPRGFLEDAAIVRIQADLMRALGAWPFHPLPVDWLESPAVAAAARDLGRVLDERLDAADGLWGFKDPRTAAFLPLWRRLFEQRGITPRYFLALRDPARILRSFMAAYQVSAATAEAVWLRRTCDALWHTRADCHLVHYEDWFRRGGELAAGLARHAGLDAAVDLDLAEVVRPELDRAAGGPELTTPSGLALNAALAICRGSDFDRRRLLEVVTACREDTDAAG